MVRNKSAPKRKCDRGYKCFKPGCKGRYQENSIYCDWEGYLQCDECGDKQEWVR